MATRVDLWGSLDANDLVQRTPLSILREQAGLLGQKTNNLIEAQVAKTSHYGSDFVLVLNIVVPGLDSYTYELLSVRHPVELYPVTVLSDGTTLRDEAQFVEWLRAKLSSPETHRIIRNLLSQATG
jgi:hypothetical protein